MTVVTSFVWVVIYVCVGGVFLLGRFSVFEFFSFCLFFKVVFLNFLSILRAI